jgi:hypothetical protein
MINPRYPYNPEEFSDFFDQAVQGKQDTLVSGENIKTINGESILGSGDLTIEGGGGTPTGYYAQYQDSITQTAAFANTGYPIKFRTADYSNGVSVVSNSRITIANTGIYNLQFSVQLENSSNQEHDATIWLRKNGTDVPGSAGFIAIVSSHGGINGHCIASWNYLLDAVGRDYYELVWSVSNTAVTMPYYPGANPPPSAASAIFTVTQQAGIMAGTGMTALNGLTDAVQTISTGTTGSDFNVASSGTNHQFNIPTASATNRGALSTADWSTFNAKQAPLVSGTNIKTVNGNSLLGSGDVSIGPKLLGFKGILGTAAGTSITICHSVLIPANTLTTNSILQLIFRMYRVSGNVGQLYGRIYFNTTNSLTGASLFNTAFTMNGGSTQYMGYVERNFAYNGTTLTSYSNAAFSEYTTGQALTVTLNRAVDNYILFTMQCQNVADTSNIDLVKVFAYV